MNEKILVVNMPSQSLIFPNLFGDIIAGASIIAGSLNEYNYDVTHYDLNLSLTSIRINELNLNHPTDIYQDDIPDRDLSEEEFYTLTTFDGLKKYLNEEIQPPRITRWIDLLYSELSAGVDLNSFDCIVFSIERRTIRHFAPICSFEFTMLFRNHITKYLDNIPMYIGGRSSIEYVGRSGLLDDILSLDPKYLPTKIFFGNGEDTFPTYLQENLEKDIINTTEPRISTLPRLTERKGCVPLIPENYLDKGVSATEILSHNITNQFPELKTLPEIYFANYAFSTGCPFKCTFCAELGTLYYNDIDKIIDSFKYFQDKGISYIRLFNNNINFKLSWVKEFCNKLIQNNIKIKWTDSANLRVYDKEMFDGLYEAGCIKLWWGTETISPRVLKLINKYVPHEQTMEVLELSHNAGIWNQCNIIVNFPSETDEEYQELLDFIVSNYSKHIINGYQLNTFQLLKEAEFFKNCEKYNIEILPIKTGATNFQYNEINGRSWPEIEKDGWDRQFRIMNHPILPNELSLFTNEPLFYALYSAYNGNIPKIQNVLKFINDDITSNIVCKDIQHYPTQNLYTNYWNKNQNKSS